MSVTPEMLEKIQAILSEGAANAGATGQAMGMDEETVCVIIKRELAPLVARLDQILTGMESKLNQLEETQVKIVSGLTDAVDSHKRNSLSGMLSSKYGPDIQSLQTPYSDILGGKDLSTDLLDILMENDEDPEGTAGGYINDLKSRFAKHIPNFALAIKTNEPGTTEGESAEPQDGEEPETPEEESGDPVTKMMGSLGLVGKKKSA